MAIIHAMATFLIYLIIASSQFSEISLKNSVSSSASASAFSFIGSTGENFIHSLFALAKTCSRIVTLFTHPNVSAKQARISRNKILRDPKMTCQRLPLKFQPMPGSIIQVSTSNKKKEGGSRVKYQKSDSHFIHFIIQF